MHSNHTRQNLTQMYIQFTQSLITLFGFFKNNYNNDAVSKQFVAVPPVLMAIVPWTDCNLGWLPWIRRIFLNPTTLWKIRFERNWNRQISFPLLENTPLESALKCAFCQQKHTKNILNADSVYDVSHFTRQQQTNTLLVGSLHQMNFRGKKWVRFLASAFSSTANPFRQEQ